MDQKTIFSTADIAARLCEMAEAVGKTPVQIAADVGVRSEATVRSWLSGRREPNFNRLCQLVESVRGDVPFNDALIYVVSGE